MLHIDTLLLKAFFEENKNFLNNSRVQKIQQPTRREIILHLRNNGESKKLYININPEFYHLCFMSKENELKRNIEIPKQPPMFCMLLRKHMEGAKIIKTFMPENERIIELTFENYNELGDRIEECLSIELMGKHSNVVLYNTDNNIILGCAHNIGAEKSKERELAGGLPYIYPPKQDKKNLLKTRFNSFEKHLIKSNEPIKKVISSKYFSISQFLAEEICKKINIDSLIVSNQLKTEEMQKLYIELFEFLEKTKHSFSVSENYEYFSCLNKLEKQYDLTNELIDDYFSYHIEKLLIKNRKNTLKTRINKELKKIENTIKLQNKQLQKEEKINLYLKNGNLLTANSYKLKDGKKTAQVFDYETNSEIEIQLDETKTIIENAQKYFNLYNKGKKAIQIANEIIEKNKSEKLYYEELLFDIEICNRVDELKQIAIELNIEEEQKNKKKEEIINIEKRVIDDYTVYIGKNNKQNDLLYSKISSPNDIWFHTFNTPGAHIIAKPDNSNTEIKDTTILQIAKLAKEYSTAKNSTKVSVIYTLRKYIKRPNNTKSGFVVYKNEEEITVN